MSARPLRRTPCPPQAPSAAARLGWAVAVLLAVAGSIARAQDPMTPPGDAAGAAAAPAPASVPSSAPAATPPASAAGAQDARCTPEGTGLRLPAARRLPASAGPALEDAPTLFEADRLSVRIGRSALAEGAAQVQRGPFTVRAERLEFEQASRTVRAQGGVRIDNLNGDRYGGSALELQLDRYRGFVLEPTYHFGSTGAGGSAARIDFLGEQQADIRGARYTSCRIEPGATPPWQLTTSRLQLDFAANEGIAESAVVRFYGVPILGLPVMSFPLTGERKSGWLPPDLETSSTVGLQVAVPYYWNIAPNHDATLTPVYSSRRGFAYGAQWRYLLASLHGSVDLYALPKDQVAQRQRWAAGWTHSGQLAPRLRYSWDSLRMSDDDYWKDGLGGPKPLAPRLLPTQAALTFGNTDASGDGVPTEGFDWGLFVRAKRFQVLQDPQALIVAPYEREPQVGLRLGGQPWGLRWLVEGEYNRFVHDDPGRLRGERVHAQGSLAVPFGNDGFTLTPRLAFNAASYKVDRPLADGRRRASRMIPSGSVDAQWSLERESTWFGRAVTQTLEPRLYYVHTAYRDQTVLPNFDSAPLDFNATSVFADSAFSGIDRVSDAHQLTAGLATRFIDRASGAEAGRLSLAQRYLLSDQRVTPDGLPLTQRLSDVLLAGSTTVVPRWAFDTTLQYGSQVNRIQRSVSSIRYFPGRYRTVNATYRYQRQASEQVELAWQWPIGSVGELLDAAAAVGLPVGKRAESELSCGGRWYSVGRADYNLLERRLAGGLLGFEYDGGCWIGRLLVERQSTSANQATTRVMWQLELVGLSRLGTNPLGVLKDNVPGYERLRTDEGARGAAP